MNIASAINETLREYLVLNLDEGISIYADGEYENQVLPKILIASSATNEVSALPFTQTAEITATLVTSGPDSEHSILADSLEDALYDSAMLEHFQASTNVGMFGYFVTGIERENSEGTISTTFTIQAYTYLV